LRGTLAAIKEAYFNTMLTVFTTCPDSKLFQIMKSRNAA